MMASPPDVSLEKDYSADFHKLRSALRANDGRSYALFVAGLKPHYGVVLRDICLGYTVLAVTMCLIFVSGSKGLITYGITAIGALTIGFWIAYLQLFMHEAAHFNLTADKKLNDWIANVCVCAIIGQEITRYRRIHFQHHRALGRQDDTEQSYASPLTPTFLLKALTGVRAVEVIARRDKHLSAKGASSEPRGYLSPWILATAAIHLAIVTGALWLQSYALAIAWVAGAGICFPFFGSLRNLLEHRPTAQDTEAGSDRAALTRIFGDDAFSRTFGGAGFNRHLLHHWEPQVSYTNLAELEAFLEATPVAEIVCARRTSYWRAFLQLWEAQ